MQGRGSLAINSTFDFMYMILETKIHYTFIRNSYRPLSAREIRSRYYSLTVYALYRTLRVYDFYISCALYLAGFRSKYVYSSEFYSFLVRYPDKLAPMVEENGTTPHAPTI